MSVLAWPNHQIVHRTDVGYSQLASTFLGMVPLFDLSLRERISPKGKFLFRNYDRDALVDRFLRRDTSRPAASRRSRPGRIDKQECNTASRRGLARSRPERRDGASRCAATAHHARQRVTTGSSRPLYPDQQLDADTHVHERLYDDTTLYLSSPYAPEPADPRWYELGCRRHTSPFGGRNVCDAIFFLSRVSERDAITARQTQTQAGSICGLSGGGWGRFRNRQTTIAKTGRPERQKTIKHQHGERNIETPNTASYLGSFPTCHLYDSTYASKRATTNGRHEHSSLYLSLSLLLIVTRTGRKDLFCYSLGKKSLLLHTHVQLVYTLQ
jgi:hypothetical protein